MIRRPKFASFLLVATLFLGFFSNGAQASLQGIQILALVGGKAISNRDLLVYSILEAPGQYRPNKSHLADKEFDENLQKLITQFMVVEDSKILGAEKIPSKDLDQQLLGFRKKMGKTYKDFIAEFQLSDQDLRDEIEHRLMVERALESRVRTALNTLSPKENKSEAARKSIEDWIKNLKERYRVQIFRYKKDA